MDVQERLASHLEQQRLQLPPAGAGPHAIMQRGRRYRRNRQVAGALGMLAIVLAAVGGAVLLRANAPEADIVAEESRNERIADEAPGTGAPLVGVAASGGPALNWASAPGVLGFTEDIFEADGMFYALSTAPGVSWSDPGMQPPLPKAIWTSGDGLAWEHTMLSEDLWSSSELGFRSGLLYLLGTAPSPGNAAGDGLETRVSISADGGRAWDSQILPSVATPPEGVGEVHWVSRQRELAAADPGVLVSVNTSYHLDYQQFIPPELRGNMVEAEPTATGIRVYDYSALADAEERCARAHELRAGGQATDADVEAACAVLESPDTTMAGDQGAYVDTREIVYEATWEELGLADFEPRFAEMHLSRDGRAFEKVPWPFAASATVSDLVGAGDGFLALVRDLAVLEDGPLQAEVWRSADGVTWQQLPPIVAESHIQWVGLADDRIVAMGMGTDTADLFVLDAAGAQWSPIDLTALLPAYEGFQENWVGGAEFGPSGAAVVISSFRGRLVTPPQPQAEGEEYSGEQVADGEVTNYLLFTSDLTSWSVEAVNELADAHDGYVPALAVGEDRVLLRYVGGAPTGTDRPINHQLVGTFSG